MTTKGIPSVPDLPFELKPEDIYRILDPLKRIIDIRQGRFDPRDRWVTQQDLIDANITTAEAVTSPVVVVPPTSVYDFQLTGDIVGGPTPMATGSPTIVMSTIIDLPNIVCIDGGDSTSTYPGEPNGPYGVLGGGGGGSAIEVEDNGISLTTGVTKFNFIGFNISEPVTDEIDVSFGPASAGAEWSPGYTYTQQSTTTFTVDLVDAENLFRLGRRIKFENAGAFDYGVVSAVDFNITHANDTFVTCTMEGGDTIPATISELYFVASDTAWSPIAADPFGGTAINDICTGVLSGTQWWVAVGDGGKLYTSTDGGASWTSRASGTTDNLYCCIYDASNAKFWVGGSTSSGAGALLRYSTDGSSWSTQTDPFTSAAGDYVYELAWNRNNNYMIANVYDASALGRDTHVSVNEWATIYASRVSGVTDSHISSADKSGSGNSYWTYSGSINFNFYSNYTDSGPSVVIAHSSAITGVMTQWLTPPSGANIYHFVGSSTGSLEWEVHTSTEYTDTVTFSNQINAFCHADLHGRTVLVGNSGTIGYLDDANLTTNDSWVSVANGFDPLTDINAIAFNEVDGVFVAVAANGQICRSTNGTN